MLSTAKLAAKTLSVVPRGHYKPVVLQKPRAPFEDLAKITEPESQENELEAELNNTAGSIIHTWISLFRKSAAVLPLFLLLACALSARAQVGAASLSGIVADQSGAVIGGAAVTLTNVQTNARLSLTSNGAGDFTFAAVPVGDYSLTITHPGFASFTETGIHLNAGDSKTLSDIALKVGTTSETVSVSSTLQGLPLDDVQLSSTISSADLDRLSIVGRDAS